jgi:hypothetical protein
MTSSPADSSAKIPGGGPYGKPRADVYTALLAVALIAILAGILVLYFENEMYEWDHKGAPTVSVDQPSALALAPDQWIVDHAQWIETAAAQALSTHHSPLFTTH